MVFIGKINNYMFRPKAAIFRLSQLQFCSYIYCSGLLYKNLKIKIYITCIILTVVLYGCETWSLKLREERRLGVFENRVLRRIFGSKRNEVREDWRKLHNEELNNFYCAPNIFGVIKSRRMRWAGHVVRRGR